MSTLFSFGYWGSGSATRALVGAVNDAEAGRGFEPPLWVDVRVSRSVRAVGFRDHAFEDLLGSNYLHMKELGNQRIEEGRPGMEIRNPAAAGKLLELALESPRRRVIFFCACELPGSCHRHEVAKLLKKAAVQRGIEVSVVEWPGGEPTTIDIPVTAAVLRAVAREAQKTLALPPGMSAGAAAALPWGTEAVLTADAEPLPVLVGPAQFSARGAHLKILGVKAGHGKAAAFRRKNGYDEI